VLARELATLEIECVPVAVVGWQSEHADASIILQPSELPVVGDVTPDQIAPLGIPGGTLRPEGSCPQPLNWGIRLSNGIEVGVHRNNVWIPKIRVRRSIWAEVPRGDGDRAGRADRTYLRLRLSWPGPVCQSTGACAYELDDVASGNPACPALLMLRHVEPPYKIRFIALTMMRYQQVNDARGICRKNALHAIRCDWGRDASSFCQLGADDG